MRMLTTIGLRHFATFVLYQLILDKKLVIVLFSLALIVIGGCFAFPWQFISRPNILIGFVLFPVTLFCNKEQRINRIYLFFMILFAIVSLQYHVRVFYFFTLAFFTLFLIELWLGRINALILFLIMFMSPFFKQIAVIMGFPIRLQLSAWAGQLLHFTGLDVQVDGNMMLVNGAHFTVDEACMGLNMLVFSMLTGVVALIHQYRTHRLQLPFGQLTFFFLVVLLLEVASNLLRILLLVIFKISPENPMHEIVGLLCFLFYVVAPIFFISQWFVRLAGKPLENGTRKIQMPRIFKIAILATALAILMLGVHVQHGKEIPTTVHANIKLPGFQESKMEDGITKLYNESALLYIKPIPEFFTGEHTPLMCWRGSGFEFEGIRKMNLHNSDLYIGKLVKPDDSLFIAWWYSNGEIQTINQWDWRMRMLQGEKFCLVSITTMNEEELYTQLNQILLHKQLQLSNI